MTTIGHTNQQAKKFYVPQKASVWCWAASIEMALKFHEIHFSQEQIATTANKLVFLARNMVRPGTMEDIDAFFNRKYLDDNGYDYKIYATRRVGLPCVDELKKAVASRPILLWIQSGALIDHLIVCTGVEIDESPLGAVTYLHILDPANPNNSILSLNGTACKVRACWIITDVKRRFRYWKSGL